MSERPSHLIVTVHGIRTYGAWQERLERLVNEVPSDHAVEFVNYKFGYFSTLSFAIPFARWWLVRRFRSELIRLCVSKPRSRIDLVGHSFGTHVIAWAVANLSTDPKISIHTVILSGSVLRSSFPWHDLLGTRVTRVINDCGSRDGILLLSQFLVFFTGMAGRTGFSGSTGSTFRNRYSTFGHSGYFLDKVGRPSDRYLREHWIPLLTSEQAAPDFDFRRPPTTVDALVEKLATHAGLIKLAVYLIPFIILSIVYHGLYTWAELQRQTALANESRALAALSTVAARDGWFVGSVSLAMAGWPRTSTDDRPRLPAVLDSLAFGLSTLFSIRAEDRHDGVVGGALLNRDESRILSWSDDNTVRLWDVATGRQIGPAMTHEGSVFGALLNRDESRILSWSRDKTVRLWDVATGRQIGPAMTHDGWVYGALLSRDESRILSWSADNTVRLWDVMTGRQIGPAMMHDDVSNPRLSRDFNAMMNMNISGALLSRDQSRILSWSADNTLRLWDAATGRQVPPAMTHKSSVKGARLSRDESRILSWSSDNTVRLWDVATGRQIGPAMTHEGSVFGALLNRDESRILSWSNDNTVRLWDVATGRQIGPAMTHEESVEGARLSRDESRILSWSNDNTVRLWDVATGRQIGPAMTHEGSVFGALLSRDESRILSWSRDKTVRLWDVATGRQIGPAMTHDDSVGGALMNQDENRILSWSGDKTVRLWNISWRGRNLLEIACNYLPPDHDLSFVAARYGIRIADPICQPNQVIPIP